MSAYNNAHIIQSIISQLDLHCHKKLRHDIWNLRVLYAHIRPSLLHEYCEGTARVLQEWKIVFFFCCSKKIQFFIHIKACQPLPNDAFMYYFLLLIWKYNIIWKFHCIFFGKVKKSTTSSVFQWALRPYISVKHVEFRYFFYFYMFYFFQFRCIPESTHACA